mmetsp:Transcript_29515/g.57912  ORF Transcript_29515/g.57912 Transcript_29515/m.57912 type:complete len:149 (-) Transcript_29515:71-517(-)
MIVDEGDLGPVDVGQTLDNDADPQVYIASPPPPAVTVQFRWGIETFRRTEDQQGGRFVYKAKGSVDGRGGLRLAYGEKNGGCWELGNSAGNCQYRLRSDAQSPGDFIGYQAWERAAGGGECWITVMKSAATDNGGWVDPALLAFDKQF